MVGRHVRVRLPEDVNRGTVRVIRNRPDLDGSHLRRRPADELCRLGGLVGWSLVMRYPNVVRRLVVASADFRGREAAPDEVPRPMPTDADFQAMRAAYEAVAPDPSHFDTFAEKVSTMVHSYIGWTA